MEIEKIKEIVGEFYGILSKLSSTSSPLLRERVEVLVKLAISDPGSIKELVLPNLKPEPIGVGFLYDEKKKEIKFVAFASPYTEFYTYVIPLHSIKL